MKRIRLGITAAAVAILAAGSVRAGENPDLETRLLGSLLTPEQVEYYSVFSQCHTHDGVCVSHAPWTSPEEVADFVAQVPDESPTPRYSIQGRLTSTATDGAYTRFAKFTITYSFVPDGTTIQAEASVPGSTTGPSNLFATMDSAFAALGGRAKWQSLLRESLERYSRHTPITFIEVTDDGAAFPSSPGSNTPGSVRGDLRFAMRPIDGVGGTQAYGLFPNASDIVLDSGDTTLWTATAGNHRAMRNLAMHNIGHALGFQHVIPVPPSTGGGTKLMEGALTTDFDGPQQDDILACFSNYGDRLGIINSVPTAAHLGELRGDRTLSGDLLAMADPTAALSDFLSFDIPDPSRPVSIHLRPIGTAYMVGPEGGSANLFDPLNRRNLSMILLGPGGTPQVASQNATGAGNPEYLNGLSLAPYGPGRYYLQVSATANAAPQRYFVAIFNDANSNSTPDQEDLARVEEAVGADNCEDAQPIDQGVIYTGTTIGATPDGRANCGGSNLSPDVWFSYTPGFSGNLDVSLCASSFDTVLSIHRGCGETEYNPAACNDDSTACSAGAGTSFIQSQAVTAGTRYLIRVSGFSGAAGNYALLLDGPDTFLGRENDNNANGVIDWAEAPIPQAAYPTFDPGFHYGELQSAMVPFPSTLGASTIPGYQGSAPAGTPEIGFRSTAALNPGFATWRRNLGFPMRRNTIYRARLNLRTDATAGSSNWIRTRLGGDFQECSGATEYGFATNAAAVPRGATPRAVEAWHWSKNDSHGASLPGQPDEPNFSFDLIDDSPTVGGHLAACSSLTIDALDRSDLGAPVILRNRGIATVSRQDGLTPPSASLQPFGAALGYEAGIANDQGSAVTLATSTSSPVSGAMNLTFSSPQTGNQTGFAAVLVNPALAPAEAYVKVNANRVYAIDAWISSASRPNLTTTRPPILRLRWTPRQVNFNQGQLSLTAYNLNPDTSWDGVYDNPSGIQLGGFSERYTALWWPSLDTTAQPGTDYLYFIDFLFNRVGTSAIRPTGTYSIERLVLSEYEKPLF